MAEQIEDPAGALRQQLRRWRTGDDKGEGPAVDLTPASAYEVVTRQMVQQLAEDVREIKDRLNSLLWMLAAAIILDIVVRLAGLR